MTVDPRPDVMIGDDGVSIEYAGETIRSYDPEKRSGNENCRLAREFVEGWTQAVRTGAPNSGMTMVALQPEDTLVISTPDQLSNEFCARLRDALAVAERCPVITVLEAVSYPLPEEMVEAVAKRMAVANNGGDWAEHYTEEQKNVWRMRATSLIDMVRNGLRDDG